MESHHQSDDASSLLASFFLHLIVTSTSEPNRKITFTQTDIQLEWEAHFTMTWTKKNPDVNHKTITTMYTQHKSNPHFTCIFYCQVSLTPPAAQDSPWISPKSQLELITKPYGMPTKPQEILKYPTTSSFSPFGQNNSLSCQNSLSAHLRPDNMCSRECETLSWKALGDMRSSHRFEDKGRPAGRREGNSTRHGKERRDKPCRVL